MGTMAPVLGGNEASYMGLSGGQSAAQIELLQGHPYHPFTRMFMRRLQRPVIISLRFMVMCNGTNQESFFRLYLIIAE